MNLHKIIKLGHYDGWWSEAIPAPRSNSEIEKSNFLSQINEIHLKDTQIELDLTHQTDESKIALLNQKIINFENGTNIYDFKINELNNYIWIKLQKLNNLWANIVNIGKIQNELNESIKNTSYLIQENTILKTNPEWFNKIYLQEKIIQNIKTINYYKDKQIDILLELKTILNKKYSSLSKIKNKYTENLIKTNNTKKLTFTERHIKDPKNNLSKNVEKTIMGWIDLSNWLNNSEIAILKMQPDSKIKELQIIDNNWIIDKILNNWFSWVTKSDIALFQIYAKQSWFYLKSENSSYKVDWVLWKWTKKALKKYLKNLHLL